MLDAIAREIHAAAQRKQKVSMLHYQVLSNADKLSDVHPHEFCQQVGIHASYATEFKKMLNLAKLMKELDVRLC